MASSTSPSSASVPQLQRQVRAQQEEIARLHQLMEKKEAEWEAAKAALFEQFRLAIERQFGPSTEKYRVAQGDLLINEAEVAADEEEAGAQDDTAGDEADVPVAPHVLTVIEDDYARVRHFTAKENFVLEKLLGGVPLACL